MKKVIILHFESEIFKRCHLYIYHNYTCIDTISTEFNLLDFSKYRAYTLLFLIPSYLITSYTFLRHEKESSSLYRARFLKENADHIVKDLSNQVLFESKTNDNIYIIDSVLINQINTYLSNLECNVMVFNESDILFANEKNSLLEFYDRFIFSFDSQLGKSCFKDQVVDFIQLVKERIVDYDPILFKSKNSQKIALKLGLKRVSDSELITLHQVFLKQSITQWFNFFSYQFSFSSLIKKSKLLKIEAVGIILGFLCFLLLLQFNSYHLNNQAKHYKKETQAIFKAISPNLTRIVNPRFQIDQLLEEQTINQKSLTQQEMQTITTILDTINKFKVKSIYSFSIFPKSNTIELSLNNMNLINYKILSSIIAKYKLVILEDSTEKKRGSVSGLLRLKFDV